MPIERQIADQPMEMVSRDIAHAVRAAAARTFVAAGSREEALRILLDIEPKLHEASQLLEIASFAGRNVKGRQRA